MLVDHSSFLVRWLSALDLLSISLLKNLILFAQNNLAPVFDFDFAFAIYSRLRNSRRGRLGPRAVGILALFAFLIAIILVIALLIAIALVVPRRVRVSLLRLCASWQNRLHNQH